MFTKRLIRFSKEAEHQQKKNKKNDPQENHQIIDIIEAKTDSDNILSETIPVELYQMMQNAAQKGVLFSFLSTMSDELVTAHLEARHYKPAQIYWINQAIRGIELIALGASLGITMAIPAANYFLTTHAGMNKEKAAALTTSAALTFGLFTSPVGVLGTSLAMTVGVSTTLISRKASKDAFNSLKNSIFAAKKTIDDHTATNTSSISNSFT